MTSLPAYKGKQIEASLLKKGFKKANKHHKFLVLFVNDQKTGIRTKISHGAKTYSGQLASCVKKQLKVGNQELAGLVECPMSADDYLAHLQNQGDLPKS